MFSSRPTRKRELLIVVSKSAISVAKEGIYFSATLFFYCLGLSVLTHTHTDTQMQTSSYTHTVVLKYKLSGVSCYSNGWQGYCLFWLWAISLLWNQLILSNKHVFWMGAWEPCSQSLDRFSIISLFLCYEKKEGQGGLGKPGKLNFSLLTCCLLREFHSVHFSSKASSY